MAENNKGSLLIVVGAQPENVAARMELVKIYLEEDNLEQALAILNEVLDIDPNRLDALLLKARIMTHTENYEEAIESYLKLLDLEPSMIIAKLELAKVYEQADYAEEAIRFYEEYFDADQSDPVLAFETLGNIYHVAGDLEKAAENYEKLLVINKDNILALTQLIEIFEHTNEERMHLYRAQLAYANLEIEKAIKEYKKAIQATSSEEQELEYRIKIGGLYFADEKLNQAIDEYNLALDLKEDPRIYKGLGCCYYELEEYEAAKTAYEKAIDRGLKDNSVYIDMADIYFELEDYDHAIQELEKLIILEPENLDYRSLIGKSYLKTGNEGAAEKTFQYVLQRNEKEPQALGGMIDVLIKSGNPIKAEDYLKRLIKVLPNSPYTAQKAGDLYDLLGDPYQSHYNYGLYHEAKNEIELAIDSFNEALSLKNENVDLLNKLGELYYRIKERAIALEHYEKALAVDPSSLEGNIGAGSIYFNMGEINKAKEHFSQAHATSPQNKGVLHHLGKIYDKERDYDQALTFYEKFLEVAPNHSEYFVVKNRVDKLKNKFSEPPEESSFFSKMLFWINRKL